MGKKKFVSSLKKPKPIPVQDVSEAIPNAINALEFEGMLSWSVDRNVVNGPTVILYTSTGQTFEVTVKEVK